MLFFLSNLILLAATGEHAAQGGFTQFYNKYLNYPGFEVWKFINLAIFVGLLLYLIKKPLSDAFKTKREAIRAELIKAEEEKQAALAQLTAAEAKLASLEAEKAAVIGKAKEEAEAERAHIAQQTQIEIAKLREQAENEINRLVQQVKLGLRRYAADESVRLAEEKLRTRINADSDAELVKSGIQAIGGLN